MSQIGMKTGRGGIFSSRWGRVARSNRAQMYRKRNEKEWTETDTKPKVCRGKGGAGQTNLTSFKKKPERPPLKELLSKGNPTVHLEDKKKGAA